jgi:hypothetical protein
MYQHDAIQIRVLFTNSVRRSDTQPVLSFWSRYAMPNAYFHRTHNYDQQLLVHTHTHTHTLKCTQCSVYAIARL